MVCEEVDAWSHRHVCRPRTCLCVVLHQVVTNIILGSLCAQLPGEHASRRYGWWQVAVPILLPAPRQIHPGEHACGAARRPSAVLGPVSSYLFAPGV